MGEIGEGQGQQETSTQNLTPVSNEGNQNRGRIRSVLAKHAGNVKEAFAALSNLTSENPVGKDMFNYLSARGLTPEELERSQIPDNYLGGLGLDVKSDSGTTYEINHAYSGGVGTKHGIKIGYADIGVWEKDKDGELVSGKYTNSQDYESVSKSVEDINRELFSDKRVRIANGGTFIVPPPSHEELAQLMRKYAEKFGGIDNSEVHWNALSAHRAKRSGLPEDKINFNHRSISEADEAAKEASEQKLGGIYGDERAKDM